MVHGTRSGGLGIGARTPLRDTGTVGSTTSTAATSRAPASGYDGLSTRTRTESRTHHGGAAGSEMSSGGFGLLTRINRSIGSAGSKARRMATMGALGFLLLVPPLTGQLMHPGISQQAVKSPIAAQLVQKSEVKTGPQIRQELGRAIAEVPSQTGSAREAALGKVIKVVEGADQQARRADTLVADASKQMNALKDEVGLDARMGYVADLYWFGVPDQHMSYHQGSDDTKALTALDQDIHRAANDARSSARGEVSKLLYQESPSFKTTLDTYQVVHGQLTAAQNIQQLAGDAYDALSTANNYVMLRNATPKTVSVDDYADRTVQNQDGTTTTVHERVGSHEESNPTWDSYNLMAIAAKSTAESRVADMNRAITASRSVIPQAQLESVDVDLIGMLDFFGHPSFLVWSFDSHDVGQAMSKVGELKGAAGQLVRSIAPEDARLDGSIQRSINMRWDTLRTSAPLS